MLWVVILRDEFMRKIGGSEKIFTELVEMLPILEISFLIIQS
jgi:hypothetical protein